MAAPVNIYGSKEREAREAEGRPEPMLGPKSADPRTPMIHAGQYVYPGGPQFQPQVQPGPGDAASMQSSVFTYPAYYGQQPTINEAIREEMGGEPVRSYFVLSLLVLICMPVCAIPAIIFAMASKRANKSGDLESALTNGKLSLALSVAAIFSGFIMWTFIILYFALFTYFLFDPYEDLNLDN